MTDEVIHLCTTCGEEVFFWATLRQGVHRFHARTGEFLCPEPLKPDLTPTKKDQ